MVNHMATCCNLNLKCTNRKCSTKSFCNIEDLKTHIENECPYAIIRCKYCHWTQKRKDIESCDQQHDFEHCVDEIKDKFKILHIN